MDEKEEKQMIITLKDGSQKEYSGSMSVIDIAKDISEGLARHLPEKWTERLWICVRSLTETAA